MKQNLITTNQTLHLEGVKYPRIDEEKFWQHLLCLRRHGEEELELSVLNGSGKEEEEGVLYVFPLFALALVMVKKEL
jgi:hypothetical protein